MKRTLLASMLIVGALAGCDKKDKDATKDTASSSAPKGSGAPAGSTKTADAKTDTPASSGGASAATAHLSANCDMVARIDVAGFFATPAIKTNVLPALEDMKKQEPKDDDGKRFKAFLTDTGMDPMTDIKEVAMCFTDMKNVFEKKGDPGMSFIIAGNFKANSIVPALLKNAKADKKMKEAEVGGVKAATDDKGEMYIGQASDNAIIVAKGKSAFEGALKTGDASKFQIPMDKMMSFIMPAELMKAAMASDKSNPFAAQADKVGRAALTADAKTLQFRIAMADEKGATELAGQVKLIMGELAKKPVAAGGPDAMVMGALKDAKIDTKGNEFIMEIAIPQDQVDAMAKQLADSIRKGKM